MDYEVGLLSMVAGGASWNPLLRALLPRHLLNSIVLQSLVIKIAVELGLSVFLARDSEGLKVQFNHDSNPKRVIPGIRF